MKLKDGSLTPETANIHNRHAKHCLEYFVHDFIILVKHLAATWRKHYDEQDWVDECREDHEENVNEEEQDQHGGQNGEHTN